MKFGGKRWSAKYDDDDNPNAFKAALREHRYSDKSKLEDNVFDLAYSMIALAMPARGRHKSRRLIDSLSRNLLPTAAPGSAQQDNRFFNS